MAARFFLHGDHLAKVILSGTSLLRPVQYDRTFLRPVQYDRTFLDSVQYGNLLNVFRDAREEAVFEAVTGGGELPEFL